MRCAPIFPSALLWLAMTLWSLGACAEAARAAAAATFRVGLSAAPVTLDPRLASDATSVRIARLIYQSPVVFDDDGQPTPALTRWEQVAPERFLFHLQSNPRFHDGRPLTAHDVAATYLDVLGEHSRSPHKGGLSHIVAIDVLDERTLEIRMARPDPMLPGRMVIGVLPASELGDVAGDTRRWPTGSGPFAVARWDTESTLVLKRLEDDARFEFLTLKDDTVRILKLARGELDLVLDAVSFELIDWIQRQESLRLIDVGGTTFSYLGVNFDSPLLADKRIREALALAVDRPAIVAHLFRGRARPAVSLLPPEHWSSDPGLTPPVFDPARARELIAEVLAERAMLSDEDSNEVVRIQYKTSSNPFRLRLAAILKQQLAEVGIELDLRSYDWGTFYADIKSGRFEVYSLSWVGLKMPDIYRYVFHSDSVPPGGANRGRYANPELDQMLELAEQQATLEAQIPFWHQVQRLVQEDWVYIPLWYEDRVAAIRRDLTGFEAPPDGNWSSLAHLQRVSVGAALTDIRSADESPAP